MGLRAKVRKARRRIDALQEKKDETRPGSDRRKKLAGLIRWWKDRLDALLKKLRRRPDFNGHPSNVTEAIKRVILEANRFGLYVTSTTDGQHATNSYHYSGRAVDVAGPWEAMVRFQRSLAAGPSRYAEVFGPDNSACVKNGVRITLAEGLALENQHDNHVHVAV